MGRHVNSLFRRIVSLALCAVMLVSLLPVSAIATELKEEPLKTEAVETETVEAETAETEAPTEDSTETPDETEPEGVPFTLDSGGKTPLAVVYAASDFQNKNPSGGDDFDTGKKVMSTIIAKTGCEKIPVTLRDICGIQWGNSFIFVENISGCKKKIVEGKAEGNIVDEENNALCYHNPSENFNVFNS